MVSCLHIFCAMRSILLLLALTTAAAIAATRFLPAAGAEPEQVQAQVRAQEIQSISIDGRGLPLATLRAVLTTHVGQLLDGTKLEQDRVALETELATLGYLAARVESPSVTFGANGGAFVSFQISQGAVFHLRQVQVSGATERDAGVVTLASGDEAIASRIERARQTIAGNLARRGKPNQVVVAMRTVPEAALVDLELITR